MSPTIRPMTASDVDAATETVLRGDWGDRRDFFAWAVWHAEAHPFVAVAGGTVVGTAVGTVNGRAGWIGAVFVDGAWRRRGLGRGLTDAAVRALEATGCATLVLVATDAGRPMYERMGFRYDTSYQTIEAPGIAGGKPSLAPWKPADLDAMALLDAAATGEDRRHLLRAFATPDSTRLLRGPGDTLRGFVVRAPWGGGATIAPDAADAGVILEARRAAAGPERRVRAGVVTANRGALARLQRLGWQEAWQAPRLIRGEPLDWQPEAIWGQFNHALG